MHKQVDIVRRHEYCCAACDYIKSPVVKKIIGEKISAVHDQA